MTVTAVPPTTGPGPSIPGEWATLINYVVTFEAETHNELLEFLASLTGGMCGLADAITEVYETHVNGVGIDPGGLQALHDVAEAQAEAGHAAAQTNMRFRELYAGVMETVDNGTRMPHRGEFWEPGGTG